MNFIKDTLIEVLKSKECKISFDLNETTFIQLMQDKYYQALIKIKHAIENIEKDDFQVVEEIVCILEEIGSSGGLRHDF